MARLAPGREWAAIAATGKSRASAQHATATRPKRNVSVRASSPNQLPVRIARRRIAGECPDIGDIGDLIRVAIDNGAGLVAGDRDHLRHEPNGELRRVVARLRADDLGLVDRDEPRLGLLLALLAILDRGLKAFIDLARQQILQCA